MDNISLTMEGLNEDGTSSKYLLYSLDGETYGINISHITDIIEIPQITKVPQVPPYIKGIINLRGKVIPIMDVRLRFKKEPRPYDDRTNIVVLDIDDLTVGIIVDTVIEVVDIADSDISRPPVVSGENYLSGIARLGSSIKLLVDTRALIGINHTSD